MRRSPGPVILSAIAIAVLPVSTNVAAGALPASWRGWLWLAWPVSLLLAVPLIVAEVRRHRTVAAVPEAAAAGTSRVWNVPAPDRHFTNRRAEVTYIGTFMLRGAGRALLLHGMAGIGKTQLAVAYAQRRRESLAFAWWIPARTRASASAALAELADRLGVGAADRDVAIRNVLRHLDEQPGWLLVFDDADDPRDLAGLLPVAAGGEVLITSRNPAFEAIAEQLMLKPFSRRHAVAFLQSRSGDRGPAAAAALADELGGLPLALEQAGAYCRTAGIGLDDYLTRYRNGRARLLRRGTDPARLSVDVTLRLALRRARRLDRAAIQVLRLLAYLAPADVPRDLFAGDAARALPAALRRSARDPLRLDATIGALRQTSLLTVITPASVRVHQLVADLLREHVAASADRPLPRSVALVRGLLPGGETAAHWTTARWIRAGLRVLAAAAPEDTRDRPGWNRAALLLPHADSLLRHVAADRVRLSRADRDAAAGLLTRLGICLFRAGDAGTAERLCRQAADLGDGSVRRTALNHLGQVLHGTGALDEAIAVDTALHAELTAAYGPDHPATATLANNLAGVLMEREDQLDRALELMRGVVAVRERSGAGHDLVIARNNTAKVLRRLGRTAEALEMSEDAYRRGVELVGAEHPDSLVRLNNLAEALRTAGDLERATALHRQAYDTRVRVLGEAHPATLTSMNNLARVLRLGGDPDEAHRLYTTALELAVTHHGPGHPGAANARAGLRDLEPPG
jgi:tetratricopeptide (TPR) repeat protein